MIIEKEKNTTKKIKKNKKKVLTNILVNGIINYKVKQGRK
jgi:hypothetical protein